MVRGVLEGYGASGSRGECSSELVCSRGNRDAGHSTDASRKLATRVPVDQTATKENIKKSK